MIPFEDECEALKIANDTSFGLAAAVWTRDIYRALRMVKAIRAGIVSINHMHRLMWKHLGVGLSSLVLQGIGNPRHRRIPRDKQVHINLNEAPIGWSSTMSSIRLNKISPGPIRAH